MPLVYPVVALRNMLREEFSLCRIELIQPALFPTGIYQPFYPTQPCEHRFTQLDEAVAFVEQSAACGDHCCPLRYVDICLSWDGNTPPTTFVYLSTERYQ